MIEFGHFRRRGLAALLLVGGLGAAAPAQAPQLNALTHIELGQWQLKEAGGGAAQSLCVADPAVLLQLGHPRAQCSRLIIDDTAELATVQYTCPGIGHGRTTIAVETPRLLHLQTQGIASGAPFDLDYEARRVGACVGKTTAMH
jgi:hypothetical protein